MYFGPPHYDNHFKLPFCLFGHTKDVSVIYEKAKFVCFINMQSQKMKFKSVLINMKHVSYYRFSRFLKDPFFPDYLILKLT